MKLETPTSTAEQAAQGHGVELAQIAKTLSLCCGERVFLVVLRGDGRLNNKKAKTTFGGEVSTEWGDVVAL